MRPSAPSAPAAPVAARAPAPPAAAASASSAARAASPPAETRLFASDAGPAGCASGECLPPAVQGPPLARPPAQEAQWRAAVEAVRVSSARHAASLAQGRLVALRPGEVVLAYRPESSFHRTTVTGQSGRASVERLLAEHFGRPTRIVLDDAAAATAPKSLAEQDAEARAAHEVSTDQTVRGHPAIRAALRILGGELEHIQVLEHERTGAPGSDIVDEPPG
ncbi:MAG: DNA polymerase III subunit gamma/tau [Myxococcaceae bacterium]